MSLTLKQARGDPGLFGSIFSGITSVASKIPGPIGWAGSAVKAITSRSPSPQPPGVQRAPNRSGSVAFAPSGSAMPGTGFPQAPTPGLIGAAQRFVPGGATGYQTVAPPAGAPSGYHVNKTSYFLKDGTFVPEQSRWVKNRHRNPLNPRAASRAIGRIESLKKATKRFSNITIKKKCCK